MKDNFDFIRLYNKLDYFLSIDKIEKKEIIIYQNEPIYVEGFLHLYDALKDEEDFKKDIRDYRNWKDRLHYLNKRIDFMLDNYDNLYFLTFTFNDNTLKKLNRDSRRQKISRWLSKYCNIYVANVDYGSKTEREHYHALVSLIDKNILIDSGFKDNKGHIKYDIKKEFYYNGKVGFTDGIEIYDKHYLKISHYINKLSNHAFKDTTKQNRIIYSKLTNLQKLALLQYKYDNIHIKSNRYGDIPSYAWEDYFKSKDLAKEKIIEFINNNDIDI